MIKVRIKKTGEIKELTKNEAFALIDKGEAEVFVKPVLVPQPTYSTRQIRPRRTR